MKLRHQLLAEFIGTFALVFAGCGAIVVNDLYPGTLGHVGICLVFGLVVMVMIYSVGNISGAHFNPAVTIGFYFAGRLGLNKVPAYVVSQVLGAVAAASVLKFIFPDHLTLGASLPTLDTPRALLMEMVLAFLLMFVILNVSTGHMEKGIMAGVAVGGTIALEALVGGPLTGASMNPARSLGPSLLSGSWNGLWIYLTAPIVGAFIACPFCRWTQGEECCQTTTEVPS